MYSVPNFGSCYCFISNPRKTCRPFREHKRLQLEVSEVFGKNIDVQVFRLKSMWKHWNEFHPQLMPPMLKCIIELYRTNENDVYVFERCHQLLFNTKYLILMHFFRLWMKLIEFWIWILNKRYACTAKQTYM